MTQTAGPPRRIKYATSDPAEAREFLEQMYGADLHVAAPRDTSWQMTFSLADAGDFSAAVAYRWGFASPSRFAARHRAAYGTLPSETLHGDG